MEQTLFEQAVVQALRDVPARQREAFLQLVRTFVRELKPSAPTDGELRYSVERHRAVRALSATVKGSLAATVSAERDERG